MFLSFLFFFSFLQENVGECQSSVSILYIFSLDVELNIASEIE